MLIRLGNENDGSASEAMLRLKYCEGKKLADVDPL
jgi:hypothetical protein